MRARFYSPTIGRFLQTDPIGYSGGNNLYAYVGNDPLNYIDPYGLIAEGYGSGFNASRSGDTNAGATTVFRVESSGNARLIIGQEGFVAVQGDNTLFLNFGDQARAESFLTRRIEQGYEGTVLKSFDVPSSYVEQLRNTSVLESEAAQFPEAALRVDLKYADQFGLRKQQIEELQQAIIQGSGKIY